MLSVLRDSPLEAFRPGALETGIPVHRWEKFIVPEGEVVHLMLRDEEGRIVGEVPGDGNVFDHQIAQERLIAEYARLDIGSEKLVGTKLVGRRPLSKADYFKLRVTALIHDVGEIEFGDVVYDDKHSATHTVRDEIAATKKFVIKALDERASRKNRSDSESGREDPRRKRRLVRNVMSAYAVDHDKTDRLHGVFKLYEKFSYVNGAISAYANETGAVAHSERLVHNVFKNQIEFLVRAASAGVPSAKAFLEERLEPITGMFAWVCRSGFKDENADHQAAFENAKAVWKKYLSSLPVRPKGDARMRGFHETAKRSLRKPATPR